MICNKCRQQVERDSVTHEEGPSREIDEESDTEVATYKSESALELLNESITSVGAGRNVGKL